MLIIFITALSVHLSPIINGTYSIQNLFVECYLTSYLYPVLLAHFVVDNFHLTNGCNRTAHAGNWHWKSEVSRMSCESSNTYVVSVIYWLSYIVLVGIHSKFAGITER